MSKTSHSPGRLPPWQHRRNAATCGRHELLSGRNLGAAGDAGAELTADDDVAALVRMLGAHGSERKYQPDYAVVVRVPAQQAGWVGPDIR